MEPNQEVNMNEMQDMQAKRKAVLTKGTDESKEYKAKLAYEVEILELEARHISAQYNATRGRFELNNLMAELSKTMQAPVSPTPESPKN